MLGADDGVCELRKFYLLPALRGLGLGQALLERCLSAARGLGDVQCYAEALDRMDEAQRLLRAHQFNLLEAPMGYGELRGQHNWYLRSL